MSGSLAFGSTGPVSLGGVVLQGFEVPESIRWGGRQQLVVHKLIGGTRVIDAMGRDDADITWSSIMLSADASERADMFDQMRAGGEVQELIFAGRDYLVLIHSFQADQRKINHVPYRISCTVLQDQSSVPYAPAVTPLGAISGDVGVVMLVPAPPTLIPVQVTLAPVQASLVQLTEIDAQTAVADAAMSSVLLAGQQAVAVRNAADSVLLGSAIQAGDTAVVGVVGDAAATIASMNAVGVATEEASTAAVMSAYIGRSQANLEGL